MILKRGKIMQDRIKMFFLEQLLIVLIVSIFCFICMYIVPIIFDFVNSLLQKLNLFEPMPDGEIDYSVLKEAVYFLGGLTYKGLVFLVMIVGFLVEEFYLLKATFNKNYSFEENRKRRFEFFAIFNS